MLAYTAVTHFCIYMVTSCCNKIRLCSALFFGKEIHQKCYCKQIEIGSQQMSSMSEAEVSTFLVTFTKSWKSLANQAMPILTKCIQDQLDPKVVPHCLGKRMSSSFHPLKMLCVSRSKRINFLGNQIFKRNGALQALF